MKLNYRTIIFCLLLMFATFTALSLHNLKQEQLINHEILTLIEKKVDLFNQTSVYQTSINHYLQQKNMLDHTLIQELKSLKHARKYAGGTFEDYLHQGNDQSFFAIDTKGRKIPVHHIFEYYLLSDIEKLVTVPKDAEIIEVVGQKYVNLYDTWFHDHYHFAFNDYENQFYFKEEKQTIFAEPMDFYNHKYVYPIPGYWDNLKNFSLVNNTNDHLSFLPETFYYFEYGGYHYYMLPYMNAFIYVYYDPQQTMHKVYQILPSDHYHYSNRIIYHDDQELITRHHTFDMQWDTDIVDTLPTYLASIKDHFEEIEVITKQSTLEIDSQSFNPLLNKNFIADDNSNITITFDHHQITIGEYQTNNVGILYFYPESIKETPHGTEYKLVIFAIDGHPTHLHYKFLYHDKRLAWFTLENDIDQLKLSFELKEDDHE